MFRKKEKQIYRGDLYYVDFSPVCGSEQGGVRPAVIIQNDTGNLYSPTVIIAATTSRLDKPNLPTHVFLDAGEYRWLRKDTVIMLEHIRTIDRSRLGDYIGSLAMDAMQTLDYALAVSLGFDLYNDY